MNAGMLYAVLRKHGIYQPERGWGRIVFAVGSACMVMAVVLSWKAPQSADLAMWNAWQRLAQLGLLVFGGGVLYTLTTLALGVRLKDLYRGAH